MDCALAILLPIFSVGTMHRAPTKENYKRGCYPVFSYTNDYSLTTSLILDTL